MASSNGLGMVKSFKIGQSNATKFLNNSKDEERRLGNYETNTKIK